jgi:hypothetical protein
MNRYVIILFSSLAFSSNYCAGQSQDTLPVSKDWDFACTGNLYVLPDQVYLNPVITAHHYCLHLEARYNYEDFVTASLFGGYNFSTGKEIQFNATPVIGIVFGNTTGIAPGLILDLYYWRINLSTESEYLLDFAQKEDSFVYTWSELTYAPTEWIWFGLAAQRTRVYQTNLEIQRGFTLGFSRDYISASGYIFNIDQEDPYGVFSIEFEF